MAEFSETEEGHCVTNRSRPYDTFLDNNSTSTNHDNDYHLSELRQNILRLKKVMHTSNVLVLSSAIIIIILYFKTSLFDHVKLRDMMKFCAHVEVDFNSLEECSKACSTDYMCCLDDSCSTVNGNDSPVDCKKYSDCAPLYQLLSPKHNAELEDACSQEIISSSKEGMINCGNKCEISECCWEVEPGEGCWEEHEQLCSNFLPCAIYYTDPSTFGMGIGPVVINAGKDEEGN